MSHITHVIVILYYSYNYHTSSAPSFTLQCAIETISDRALNSRPFFELVFPLKTNQRQPLRDQSLRLRASIYLAWTRGEEILARPRGISTDNSTIVHNYEMCCDSERICNPSVWRRTMRVGNERRQSREVSAEYAGVYFMHRLVLTIPDRECIRFPSALASNYVIKHLIYSLLCN